LRLSKPCIWVWYRIELEHWHELVWCPIVTSFWKIIKIQIFEYKACWIINSLNSDNLNFNILNSRIWEFRISFHFYFPRSGIIESRELWIMSELESYGLIFSKYVLFAANAGHMINRKGGQPNQGICHKVGDGSGQFECPYRNMTILAIPTKDKPSLLIKTSGNNDLSDKNEPYGVHYS